MLLVLAAFIVLLAAFIRSISGFGYNLLANPLLTFVFEAKSVVVMNVILGNVAHILVLFQMRRHIDFRRLLLIGLGSVFGVPLGAYLLATLDASLIRLAIAVLVIPFSVLLLLGHRHRFERDTLGCGAAGLVSGVLVSSTGLGAPPVILFLLNQGLIRERFVATMAAYLLFSGILSIGAFASLGMITADLLTKVAVLLPALFLGSYLGVRMLPRVNAALFRRIVPALLSIIVLVIIVSVIAELWRGN